MICASLKPFANNFEPDTPMEHQRHPAVETRCEKHTGNRTTSTSHSALKSHDSALLPRPPMVFSFRGLQSRSRKESVLQKNLAVVLRCKRQRFFRCGHEVIAFSCHSFYMHFLRWRRATVRDQKILLLPRILVSWIP